MKQTVAGILALNWTLHSSAFMFAFNTAQAQTWEQLGPGGGGQIVMIEGSPYDDSVLYIGSDVAGLWCSTNGQAEDPSYQFLTGGLGFRYCQDVDFDPVDSNALFAAMSDGVFYSPDRGVSWQRFGTGLDDPYVSALSVCRQVDDEYRIYAGIGYTRDGSAGAGCIYRYHNTTNTTAAWSKLTLPCSSNAAVYQLKANPNNSQQVWAITDDGVYYSADSGNNWTARTNGLAHGHARAIAVNPSNFQRAFLVLGGSSSYAGGLCFWDGSAWQARSGDLPLDSIEWTSLAVDPSASTWGERIFLGSATTGYGCYMTTNGTSASPSFYERKDNVTYGWTPGNKILANPHSLAFAGSNLWVGKNGNFFRGNTNMVDHASYQWIQEHSTDCGDGTWDNRGMVNTVLRMVAVDPANSNHVLMAVADRGVWRSVNGGGSFSRVTLQIDGKSIQDAYFVKFDEHNGNIYAGGGMGFGSASGTGAVYCSTDGGSNWTLIAGGVKDTGGLNGADNEPWDIDFSVFGNRIWLGIKGEDSGVYQSVDGGTNWSYIGMSGTAVLRIKAHPANNDRFMVGTRVFSGTKGIWRADCVTNNWGFSKNLSGEDGTGFVYHPDNPGFLTASTSGGLYQSTDNGATWTQRLSAPVGSGGFGHLTRDSATSCLYSIYDGTFDVQAQMVQCAYTSNWNFGKTWTAVSTELPQLKAAYMVLFEPTGELYVATKGMGLWVCR